MNIFNQDLVTPAFKYNTQVIGNALRTVARKNKRPDYPVIICREVCEAIKNDTPHSLKSEVLGILHHSASCVPSYDENAPKPKRGRPALEDIPESYTPEYKQKIDFIAEWCKQDRGRYHYLARTAHMSLTGLKMRITFKTKARDSSIDRAYNVVMEHIAQSTNGANPKYGTHDNERFFAWLLEVYIKMIADRAYKDMSKREAKSYRVGYKTIQDKMCIMGKIVGPFKPFSRIELGKRAEQNGLVVLSSEVDESGCKQFRLADTDYTKELYKLAFSAIKPLHDAGYLSGRFKFSNTEPGLVIINNLLRVAYHHFDISEKYRTV